MIKLEQLSFKNYEVLACDIADKFENIDDQYGEISIVAKYYEAKDILKELVCIGYDIVSVELFSDNYKDYNDEYILSLNFEGVWCEQFKRDNEYCIEDKSNVIYIMDNCSSKVITYCKSKNVYEVSVDDPYDEGNDDNETKHSYSINGKPVDKETYNRYVSKFVPELVNDKNVDTLNDSKYPVFIKHNLPVDESMQIIKDMEHRIMHINEMFREMDNFRQLFDW